MKTYILPLGLLSMWLGYAQGLAALRQAEPTVTERGPHHRVWARANVTTLPNGSTRTNISSYVELGSGLHRWDAQAGQFVDASDLIEIAADGSGAFGRNAAHQVRFSPNANTAGAITLITPDGKTIRSHALSLAWFDSATGQSEQIASIKDSVGELHAPNVVIYSDAFDGGPGFRADIRYTYRLGGFSQDIVILTRPPDLPPGYAPDTTRIEVWTEIIEAPGVTLTQVARGGMTDDTLDFGAMQTGPGRTFVLGDEANPKRTVPVAKRWHTAEGRTFLVEAVRYLTVKPELDRLPVPQGQAGLKPRNANAQLAANVVGGRLFPPAPPTRAKKGGDKFRTAAIAPPRPTDASGSAGGGAAASLTNAALSRPSAVNGEKAGAGGNSQLSAVKAINTSPGLVIDYDLVASLTNFTLQCDTTYLVTNAVNFYGTTVFEGGCVVKFSKTNIAQINLNGTNVWRTAQYRPAIFTAVDDHTIGTRIGSGTLSSNYGGAYLKFSGGGTLEHARLSHARIAVQYSAHLTNRHVQFVHCSNALEQVAVSTSIYIALENVLLYDIGTVFKGGGILHGYHLTAHQCSAFMDGSSATLYNSLILDDPSFGDTTTSFNSSYQGSSSGVVQTIGAAAHYLAGGSPHRDVGTTNGLNASLLADLRKRTTYPPIVLSNMVLAQSTNLSTQATRDTDTPDLGYHYDPVDFAFGALLATNVNIVVQPGTAIAIIPTPATWALVVAGQSQFLCDGLPTNLNRIVRCNTVQEQANTNWIGAEDIMATGTASGANPVLIRCRFTDWIGFSLDSIHIHGGIEHPGRIELSDFRMDGGWVISARPSVVLTNALFYGSWLSLNDQSGAYTPSHSSRNSLFHRATVELAQQSADTWTWKDNLFSESVVEDFSSFYIDADYNGYTTNTFRLAGGGTHDVQLATNNLNFKLGPLGAFYLATNGPATNLFDAGSTYATNVGLYHFTTTTNQVKEAGTMVDIGLHYVAVNSGGLATDSDGDMLPDYLEDANGNGVRDGSESNWNNAHSDNDGLSDYLEWLLGGNPLVSFGTDTNALIRLQIYLPFR